MSTIVNMVVLSIHISPVPTTMAELVADNCFFGLSLLNDIVNKLKQGWTANILLHAQLMLLAHDITMLFEHCSGNSTETTCEIFTPSDVYNAYTYDPKQNMKNDLVWSYNGFIWNWFINYSSRLTGCLFIYMSRSNTDDGVVNSC